MSIGTALLFSGIFIGLVLLYSATKDRWRWRGITKVIALSILSIVLLATAAGIGVYAWQQFPWPIEKQTEYAGLKLGLSKADVLYIKGYPPTVLGETTKDPDWQGFQMVIDASKLDKGKKVQDYNDWQYSTYQGNITVTFAPDGGVISIQCYSNDRGDRCPPIASVADGASESELLKRFGQPSSSKITGVTKSIRYPNIGSYFYLEKEQVYMLGINDTRYRRAD